MALRYYKISTYKSFQWRGMDYSVCSLFSDFFSLSNMYVSVCCSTLPSFSSQCSLYIKSIMNWFNHQMNKCWGDEDTMESLMHWLEVACSCKSHLNHLKREWLIVTSNGSRFKGVKHLEMHHTPLETRRRANGSKCRIAVSMFLGAFETRLLEYFDVSLA